MFNSQPSQLVAKPPLPQPSIPAHPTSLTDFLGREYGAGDLVVFPSITAGRALKRMVVGRVREIRASTREGESYINRSKIPIKAAVIIEPIAANWGFKYKAKRILIRNTAGILKLTADIPLEGVKNG